MLLTQKQAAELLQVSVKTIGRRIRDGSIQAIRLSDRAIRIDKAELERYVQSKKGR